MDLGNVLRAPRSMERRQPFATDVETRGNMASNTMSNQRQMHRRPHGPTRDGRIGVQMRIKPGISPLLRQGALPDVNSIAPRQVLVDANQEPKLQLQNRRGEEKEKRALLEMVSQARCPCLHRQPLRHGLHWTMQLRWLPTRPRSLKTLGPHR